MKKHFFLILGLSMLAACGNVTPSSSFSPTQRITNSETALSRVGIVFEGIAITKCESIYKVSCLNKISALNEYIRILLDNYGSESNLPLQYQQRVTAANDCIDNLTKSLKNPDSPNCHR